MRARALLLVALALLGGAVALDEMAVPAARQHAVPTLGTASSGVLGCAWATEAGAPAMLSLANVGTESSSVRVTLVTERGRGLSIERRLEPETTQSVNLARLERRRAGVIVEYAGGEVVASHLLMLRGPRGGEALAPCSRAGGGLVTIARTRTLAAETRLALLNPGTADADVTVELIADGRRLAPERLKRRIVPGRTLRVFRVGDFAFDARDVTVLVSARSGRVVAEALVQTAGGASMHVAASPAGSLVGVVGTGVGASFGAVAVGDEDAGIAARELTQRSQGRARGIPDSLAPDTGAIASVRRAAPAAPVAYALDVSIGSGLAAGSAWTRRIGSDGDLASVEAVEPSTRWGTVVTGLAPRGSARAILANPQGEPVRVRVRRFGSGGAREGEVVVPAGRVVVVALGRGRGTFAGAFEADAPIAVVVEEYQRWSLLYAGAAAATPLVRPTPVAVVQDPAVGVPALRG